MPVINSTNLRYRCDPILPKLYIANLGENSSFTSWHPLEVNHLRSAHVTAWLAQSAARRSHNPKVASSSLALGSDYFLPFFVLNRCTCASRAPVCARTHGTASKSSSLFCCGRLSCPEEIKIAGPKKEKRCAIEKATGAPEKARRSRHRIRHSIQRTMTTITVVKPMEGGVG